MNNKWILNLVITISSFALISCGGGGSDPAVEETGIKKAISEPEVNSNALIINIEQDLSFSGFTISCPSDVSCNDVVDSEMADDDSESHADNDSDSENDDDDESHADSNDDDNGSIGDNVGTASNSNSRNYKFENEQVYFYLSLDQAIIDNYSLAAFKENFNYFNFQIFFPEKDTENSKFYFTNASPIELLNDQSVDAITFTIIDFADNKLKGKIEGTINSITERVESDDPDCMTDGIEGICFKSETADIPFTINFNLTVE